MKNFYLEIKKFKSFKKAHNKAAPSTALCGCVAASRCVQLIILD
jgi:hypothetical protein